MEEPKTVQETLAELRAQPGIDLTRQRPGAVILVETTQGIIEIEVIDGVQGLVRISGTDPKIKEPKVCLIVQSDYDLQGLINLPFWIGKDLRMKLVFNNATLHASATLSVSIKVANGWYEVF